MPSRIAPPFPSFLGYLKTRTLRDWYAAATSAVRSRDPSATTITSKRPPRDSSGGTYRSRVRARRSSSFHAGMMILIPGSPDSEFVKHCLDGRDRYFRLPPQRAVVLVASLRQGLARPPQPEAVGQSENRGQFKWTPALRPSRGASPADHEQRLPRRGRSAPPLPSRSVDCRLSLDR